MPIHVVQTMGSGLRTAGEGVKDVGGGCCSGDGCCCAICPFGFVQDLGRGLGDCCPCCGAAGGLCSDMLACLGGAAGCLCEAGPGQCLAGLSSCGAGAVGMVASIDCSQVGQLLECLFGVLGGLNMPNI